MLPGSGAPRRCYGERARRRGIPALSKPAVARPWRGALRRVLHLETVGGILLVAGLEITREWVAGVGPWLAMSESGNCRPG